MDEAAEPGRVRLDKWLWAARFNKTRSLAAAAVAGGKVLVNGDRAKRGRRLNEGDSVTVRHPPFETHVVVRALSEHRGRAADAARLFTETPASHAAREGLAAQLRALPKPVFEEGRPTKKNRRTLDRWRGR
jgi:ribosome-associated heat shock protein Hsp15